jgi:hypothetical protein
MGSIISQQIFDAVVTTDTRKRVLIPLPFDPDDAWGHKKEHRVHGTVDGMAVRAVVEPLGEGYGIFLGPAWRRHCGIGPGDEVEVTLAPEGRPRSRARSRRVLRLSRPVLPEGLSPLDRRHQAEPRDPGGSHLGVDRVAEGRGEGTAMIGIPAV